MCEGKLYSTRLHIDNKTADVLHRKRGFTLIEFLIVLAIIAILTKIVMSSVSQAKSQAFYLKARSDVNTIFSIITQYSIDKGSWPLTGNQYVTSAPGGGWDNLMTALNPYVNAPGVKFDGFPTIVTGNALYQGYSYSRGTSKTPTRIQIFNSLDSKFVGCVILYDGYYIDFVMPTQSSLTLDDGGIDPDGIDKIDGNYKITYNISDCSIAQNPGI